MLGLSIFLVFISMIAFFVCLILLIVNVIKKKPLKPYAVGLGLSLGIFFVGCLLAPTTDDTDVKKNTEIKSETIVNTETESPNTEKDIESEVTENTEKTTESESTENTEISEYDKVKNQIKSYINANYTNTVLDDLTVNDDAGTDEDGDYVVLVNLTWNQKNTGKTSQEMLDMYSSDMAARIYQDLPEVQELCIFWTVPYLNDGTAKISFERKDNGMAYTDKVFDNNFN